MFVAKFRDSIIQKDFDKIYNESILTIIVDIHKCYRIKYYYLKKLKIDSTIYSFKIWLRDFNAICHFFYY